jgi:hypothetical protein
MGTGQTSMRCEGSLARPHEPALTALEPLKRAA